MKSISKTPIQFHTNEGLALSLINSATGKRLAHTRQGTQSTLPRATLTGEVLNDIIELGSQAFITHVGQLLLKNPVQSIQDTNSVIRIRVCAALDYVIDRTQQQVWAEPAPHTAREGRASEQPPWYHPMNGKFSDFDVLNPLCKPMWLNYIAVRPGWFGYTFSRHSGTQKQLFIENDEMAHALQMVVRAAWRHYCKDAAFNALRHQVATALALHIGPNTIDLAMRARLRIGHAVLPAKHLNLVLRHQRAFKTMALENPKLLTALTAWLEHPASDSIQSANSLNDALPAMRQSLLASGLPPRAWRYLTQHGLKALHPDGQTKSGWSRMIKTLQALNAARWPPLPPLGFLRLLHDTAGTPRHYKNICDRSTAGWFWQMTCEAAHTCHGDTAAYTYLFDQLPEWAWMVRHYRLMPDKNQRRKGIEWLEFMSDVVQSIAAKKDVPEWALWLPAEGWDSSHKLQAIPLQSRVALLREAFALHNCADGYEDQCRAESRLLISLRSWADDKPIALVCLETGGSCWQVVQIAGPCNKPVADWVRLLGNSLCAWVDYHYALHFPPLPLEIQEAPFYLSLNWD